MNKTVLTHHIKAAELPAHLRGDIPPEAYVNVRVEGEQSPLSLHTLLDMLDTARSNPAIPHVSKEEAVARIRALRDEWDT